MSEPERTIGVGPPAATPSLDLEGQRARAAVMSRLTGRDHQTRIGRYVLQRMLGEGGFGAVFLAHDPELDRDVAIKVARERASADSKARERLAAEARALAQLGDRHVVQIFDVGTDTIDGAEHLYIVMEHLAGPTLHTWLHEQHRSPDELLHVFGQAALGLAAAHSIGVVHRDFKPANAMFTADGRLKVLDFGLASGEAATAPSERSGESEPSRLTQTGLVMGTPRYMAPEQHTARNADERSDQYALCVALWEALVGRPPFDAQTVVRLGRLKAEGAPPRPPAIARHVYRVLARGLAVDPGHRFASMRQLHAALLRPRRGSAVVLGVAALAVAGVLAVPRDEPTPALCEAEAPSWSPRFAALIAATTPERTSPQWGLQAQVQRRLSRFEAQWTDARTQVCEAGQPALPVDRSVAAACLQRGAERFETLLATVDDPDVRERMRTELVPLAVPSRCLGGDAAIVFVPPSPERAAEIGRLDAQLLAEPAPSLPELDALAVKARALESTWLVSRIGQLRATALRQAGRPRQAADAIDDAVWHAESMGDSVLAAELFPQAIGNLIDAGLRPEEIAPWFQRGYRLADAAGRPAGPTARLLIVDATATVGRDIDEALTKVDEALALVGDDPPAGAEAQLALALQLKLGLAFDTMTRAAVQEGCRRALALGVPSDPWYPSMAGLAHHLLSESALGAGDEQDALVERLLQYGWIQRVTHNPDAPQVLVSLAGVNQMLAYAGAPSLALPQMELAYHRLRAGGGGAETQQQLIASDIAEVDIELARWEDAARWARTALDDHRTQLGDHPDLIWDEVDLARAELALGHLEQARAAADAALRHARPADREEAELRTMQAALAAAEGRWTAVVELAAAQLAAIPSDSPDPRQQGLRADTCAAARRAQIALGDPTAADAMLACQTEATRRAPLRAHRAPAPTP